MVLFFRQNLDRKGRMNMKREQNRDFWTGIGFFAVFLLWTALIRRVDVDAAGPLGTSVGFAALNTWFHRFTGVHMALYNVTDWLGLVPIAVCLCFGILGLAQLVRRRDLRRVDPDIILLGFYYILVVIAYLVFEMIPINYRPVLINGALEASYPSSTTLLVLSVMPTLSLQMNRRSRKPWLRRMTGILVILFSAFTVIGRMVSGVHWATDIIGAIFLSTGCFMLYRSSVRAADQFRRRSHGIP